MSIFTNFGLQVRYDGDHLLEVGISSQYSGAVEGRTSTIEAFI